MYGDATQPMGTVRWKWVWSVILALFLLAILVLGIGSLAYAGGPTYVSGTITGDVTWSQTNSPYIVQGRVTVDSSARLTIEPGVEVRLQGIASIDVEGILVAEGTAAQPITFTADTASVPAPGTWQAIFFRAGSSGRLRYCDVNSGGYHGVNGGAALYVAGDAALTLAHCRVHHNAKEGIRLDLSNVPLNAPPVRIEDTEIDHNGERAILQRDLSAVVYRNLNLHDNGTDAVVLAGGTLTDTVRWDFSQVGAPVQVSGPGLATVDLKIGKGGTLEIAPASELRFWGRALVVDDGGALRIEGTATQPVTLTVTDDLPKWQGIWFQPGSAGSLQFCDIGQADHALTILSSDIEVNHCRVHHSTLGVVLQGQGLSPTIAETEIDHNADEAIRQAGVDMTPTYRALTIHDNGFDGVRVLPAGYNPLVVRRHVIWDGSQLGGKPFRVEEILTVAKGYTLTLEAGTMVEMQAGFRIDVQGALIAEGAPTQPVTVTGVTGGSPTPGFWKGIFFWPGASGHLRYCDVNSGGNLGSYKDAALVVEGDASLTLSHCRIHHNQRHGIWLNLFNVPLNAPSVRIEDTEIDHHSHRAIYQRDLSAVVYRNLNLHDNGTDAVVLSGGTLTDTLRWDFSQVGAPVWVAVDADLRIRSGGVLDLAPGSALHFASGRRLSVEGGALLAMGEPGRPITLTGTAQTPGAWHGVRIDSSSSGVLRHCRLGFGGGNYTDPAVGPPLLEIASSNVVVQGCHIFGSSGDGVRIENSAQPSLVGNAIYSNTFGVRNTTPSVPVDARQVWWGDASGPYHAATNPNGKGNPVSDGVLFDPWRTAPLTETLPSAANVLIFQLGGPTTVEPGGPPVRYALFYRNETTRTLHAAVAVLALPMAAQYVDSTHGGIYWPDRHQVFWRLGDLAPGTQGLLSVRLAYPAGLPLHSFHTSMAFLLSREIPILRQTDSPVISDLDDYLTYIPQAEASRVELDQATVQQMRQQSPDLDWFYTDAENGGFSFGTAHRITLANGRVYTQVVLIALPQRAVRYLYQMPDGTALAIGIDAQGVTIMPEQGSLILYDPTTSSFRAVTRPGSRARAGVGCVATCVINKVPGWIFSNAFRYVGMFMTAKDCVSGLLGSTGDLARCVGSLARVPLVGEVLDTYDCIQDCRKPSKGCTQDKVTCAAGWADLYRWLGIERVQVIRCNKQTGQYESLPEYLPCAPGEKCVAGGSNPGCKNCRQQSMLPRLRDTAINGPSVSASIAALCQQLTGDGSPCSGQSAEARVAGDPNRIQGPEGDLVPGQVVTYTIHFSNQGSGRAYGVFVVAKLPDAFDPNTVQLRGSGTFITPTQTFVWGVGTLEPKDQPGSSGVVTFTAQLRSDLASGTVITAQATVHFPSVPEITPTNVWVNVIEPLAALPQQVETPAATPVSITLAGREAANRSLTFAVADPPLYGELSNIQTGNQQATVTYTPSANFSGVDRFTFQVSNGITTSRPAQVTILVQPGGGDTTPPQVIATVPVSGSQDVAFSTTPVLTDAEGAFYAPFVRVRFSEPISATTVTTATVRLEAVPDGKQVPAVVRYDDVLWQAILLPKIPLSEGTEYWVILEADQIRDRSNNALSGLHRFTFRTAGPAEQRLYLPMVQR